MLATGAETGAAAGAGVLTEGADMAGAAKAGAVEAAVGRERAGADAVGLAAPKSEFPAVKFGAEATDVVGIVDVGATVVFDANKAEAIDEEPKDDDVEETEAAIAAGTEGAGDAVAEAGAPNAKPDAAVVMDGAATATGFPPREKLVGAGAAVLAAGFAKEKPVGASAAEVPNAGTVATGTTVVAGVPVATGAGVTDLAAAGVPKPPNDGAVVEGATKENPDGALDVGALAVGADVVAAAVLPPKLNVNPLLAGAAAEVVVGANKFRGVIVGVGAAPKLGTEAACAAPKDGAAPAAPPKENGVTAAVAVAAAGAAGAAGAAAPKVNPLEAVVVVGTPNPVKPPPPPEPNIV